MPKRELRFNMEGTSPHTLPMMRLAEYLKQLASVLGSEDGVHFLRVEEGSAPCVIEVDEDEEASVISRAKKVARGDAPKEAIQACESLRAFLQEDGISAALETDEGDVILSFPLTSEKEAETFGPFWQDGVLDGILVRIGGMDETIHAHLIYEGAHYACETNHEIGRELGLRFLRNPVRVYGKGKWFRNAEGKWELQKFVIRSFEDLEETSLLDIVARLRAIPENALGSLKDPIGEMLKIRRGVE